MARKVANTSFGTLTLSSVTDNVDDDEIDADDGVLFYVNKSGFPINNSTWERMWHHVAKIHPGGYGMVNKIREEKVLREVIFYLLYYR